MKFYIVRLIVLLMASTAAEEITLPTSGTFNPSLQSFDDAVMGFMKRHSIPGGALAIVDKGRLIYVRGYGYADRDHKTPVQPTSLFRLASVSKPITAAAIMTMVEAKKLDLDTKVVALLKIEPFLKAGELADPRIHDITVRNLLQHTGGWDRDHGPNGDFMFKHFQIAADMGIVSPPDHASLIRWGFGKKLDFDPGSKFVYSNFGYCVLGRVIEKVSGQTYEDYVREHVLTPMGIHDMRIGLGRESERMPNEVVYYDAKSTKARNVFSADGPEPVPLPYAFASPQTMDAHGGWIASAVDLARFAAALDRPRDLVSERTQLSQYSRPLGPPGLKPDGSAADVFYGMGWMVRVLDVKRSEYNVWHNGAMPGTSTLLVRLAKGRSWLVLFNQRADGSGSDNMDSLLHAAASKVTEWPSEDLFKTYP